MKLTPGTMFLDGSTPECYALKHKCHNHVKIIRAGYVSNFTSVSFFVWLGGVTQIDGKRKERHTYPPIVYVKNFNPKLFFFLAPIFR